MSELTLSKTFGHASIDLEVLRRRAFNLRWAAVPPGVIPLTAADPDFPCAPPIAAAIQRFVDQRYFSYGPTHGLDEFKEAMSTFLEKRRGHVIRPANILPVDSAAFGIHLVCKTFLQPGDEAIIFDPVDFLFRYSIENVGAKAIPFSTPQQVGLIDFTPLEALITDRTRMICLCNPLNPTGKVFSKSELQQLSAIATKHDLLILSDEIWSDIVFGDGGFTAVASLGPETAQRTIVVTGFSKSYGLAGLRIGAVMTSNDEHYAKLVEASLYSSTIHGANVLSQVAAVAALNECQSWLEEFVDHLQSMRDLFVDGLNRLPGVTCIAPQGCYVAFADIRGTGKSSADFRQWLLERAKVAAVPGLKQWFGEGAEGFVRFSFATSQEVLEDALERMNQAFKNEF